MYNPSFTDNAKDLLLHFSPVFETAKHFHFFPSSVYNMVSLCGYSLLSRISSEFEHLFVLITHVGIFYEIVAYDFVHFSMGLLVLFLLIQKMLNIFDHSCYRYFLSVCDLPFTVFMVKSKMIF